MRHVGRPAQGKHAVAQAAVDLGQAQHMQRAVVGAGQRLGEQRPDRDNDFPVTA